MILVSPDGNPGSFSAPTAPASGAVHIWLCRVAGRCDEPMLARYRALLTPQELSLCERMRDPQQKYRALLTRVLIRTVLSYYGPLEPGQWRFATDGHGKPCIEQSESSLSFNLSHAGQWIVCAVTEGPELGVDVEYCDPDRNLLRLAERFFAPEEARALQSLTGSARVQRFYDYWTLKESWLKATGLGVGGGLDQIVFEFGDDGRLAHRVCGACADVRFKNWQLNSAYRLSLCYPLVGGQPVEVELFGVEPLVKTWPLSLAVRYSSQRPVRGTG